MFGTRRVALFAAAAVASGMLSLSAAPVGAQALRLGLVDPGALNSVAAVEDVAWRGGGRGGGFRGAGMRGGGFRGMGARGVGVRGGGFRAVGPRVGGGRFVGAGMGPRRVAVARPGWNRPGWNRPGWNGPGVNRPGWNRPGWNRPGWGPGVGWGRPGWRPPPGAWGPGAWRPGWGWYRPGWGWGYYNNTGAWIALGVASAVAVGAVAAANADDGDSVAYCMQRFRSYNPNTGTYTGYDGFQHPCP